MHFVSACFTNSPLRPFWQQPAAEMSFFYPPTNELWVATTHVGMGGALRPKLVWPEHGLPCFWCAVGVASNANLTKSWYGKGKVGVAMATPTIWHSPPMHVGSSGYEKRSRRKSGQLAGNKMSIF